MSFTVYRSSAGSGKTYTLVKEYLKIALNTDTPDKYRDILAITFTNKAANEMKQRVLTALVEISGGETHDVSAYLLDDLTKELGVAEHVIKTRADNTLTHLLHHYADFSISTIDKFVHRIIRTFAQDLNIPLNFEVEMDVALLLSNAIDRLISQVGKNPKLTRALVDFAESKTDNEKSWNIEKDLLQFALNALNEEGHKHLEQLRKLTLDDFFQIRDDIYVRMQAFEAGLHETGVAALSKIEAAGIDHSSFAGGKNGIGKYFIYLAKLRSDKIKPSDTVKKNVEAGKWHSTKADESQRAAIDNISEELETLFIKADTRVSEGLSDYRLLQAIFRNIYPLAVLNELEKTIEEIKSEHNVLLISEFNIKIAEIVAKEPAPFIYERLGEKYKHYLIDEFQDTSIMQWHNLLPLVENSLASGHYNMLVGDGKQAIYRWRGGDVEQFARLPGLINPAADRLLSEREKTLNRFYKPRTLQKNFRSKTEIVEFNNFLFDKLSGELDEAARMIYEGHTQHYDMGNTGGFVSVESLQADGSDEQEHKSLGRVATIIERVLVDGYFHEDIAILCRKNSESALVANYLTENGIPVVSPQSLLLKSDAKVNFTISLLQYLQQPSDRIAQTGIVLFLIKNGSIRLSIHEAVSMINNPVEGFQLSFYLKETGFAFNPTYLKQLAVYEIIEEITRIFHFNDTPDPFMLYLLEAAYEQDVPLSEFLIFWEDHKDLLSVKMADKPGAIRVMTIHQAKGLEFKVVILPFANWGIRKGKDELWVSLDNPDLPLKAALVSANNILKDTVYASQYEEEMNKSLLDNINLLYVACTRPRDRLYMINFGLGRGDNIAKYYMPALQKTEHWNEERSSYCLGVQKQNPESGTRQETPGPVPDQINSNSWLDKTAIAVDKIDHDLPVPDQEGKRHYGKMVHKALSRINTVADINPVISQLLLDGDLPKKDAEKIEQKLHSIITNQLIEPMFRTGIKARNEAEILLQGGHVCRPDRVIIEDKKAIIIDYKTGRQHDSHKEQLNRYANALSDMGYNPVEKYIILIEEEELIAV